MKQFNRESVTDSDMELISMLGYSVMLYDNLGQILICGTLHTDSRSPMVYFTVTNVTNNDHQWVFSYDEISSVNSNHFQISIF